jgi:RNA polymerase sigma-70 factor (ECF subfamily)
MSNLITSAQQGDTRAFDELIRDCLPKLKNLLAKHYHLQDTDFDDVIQVASNKAWTKIANFRGDSSFLTWFYTILRNETLNFVKKKNIIDARELPAHFLDIEDGSEEDYEHILKCSINQQLQENAESILARKETLETYRQIIEDVLHKLTPDHRQIIQLVIQDEMTYREVSEKLKIPIGTVMSRFFFARKNAQKLIKQQAESKQVELECLSS